MAHGVMDTFHGNVIENTGVPAWWPAFCAAFDVGAAACLAWYARTWQSQLSRTVVDRATLS